MLVISRFELDPNLIPPFKLIIPMLDNLYPVRVFTSADGEVTPPKGVTIYEELVRKLESHSGFCCLTKTLDQIIKQYDDRKTSNYRVCIFGHERVDWGVIMEFKRRGIVVDTVCGSAEKNQLLVQISYITGGVHKTFKESSIVKAFQSEIGMSSKIRHHFRIDKKDSVEFSLKCTLCPAEPTSNFLACSICMSVYCLKHEKEQRCISCGYFFD